MDAVRLSVRLSICPSRAYFFLRIVLVREP